MSSLKDSSAILSTSLDDDYDYEATSPSVTAADGLQQMHLYQKERPPPSLAKVSSGTEEALLDLAQLEELQQEAERMKALGNKHMAAQVRT
jgi:hypothetical protein